MVLITSVNELFDIIDNIDWFHSVGKPIQDKNVIVVYNVDEAINHWLDPSFEEARSIAWEAFRQLLVKDPYLYSIWEKEYNLCKNKLAASINNSPLAIKIAGMTKKNVDEFSRALPFVGAVGELLLGKLNEYSFNLHQIPYYESGHWVCGWRGKISANEFIYPEKNFYLY